MSEERTAAAEARAATAEEKVDSLSAEVSRLAAAFSAMEQRVATRVDQQIQQRISGLTIQSGPGIQVSGSGTAITVGLIPNNSGVGAPAGNGGIPGNGYWKEYTDCNDDDKFHWVMDV